MDLFTSARERRLWLWVLLTVAAIYATLFMGRPLANQLRDQNLQAVIFVLGMLLAGTAVLLHGWRTKPGKFEMSVLLGIAAVYVMFFFRLGAPERSHLIEYSVLAVFLHRALLERSTNKKPSLSPALLAIGLGVLIGLLDEVLQFFLPNRTFDPEDMFFNGFAVIMAIAASSLLN
ncbi:VanZ family protein [Algoriphagus sp. H41]|uniref:VanZ family protein n=1 Tax=Algoriphagus oliviformis TaxID=2811231 RepID=A0ABS3C5T6_9BACT|nr:VanZ family protein [Algoriphagus oliviformis]MBN7812482.1 VanZ family protein [Algoriphagus oliviformis]